MLAHHHFESAATRSHVRQTKDNNNSVVGMKVPQSMLLMSEPEHDNPNIPQTPEHSQVDMVELCQRITALGGHFLAKLLALLQQVQPTSLRYDQAQWVFDTQTFTDLTLSKVQDFVEESLKDHANNNNNAYSPTKPTNSNHQLNDNAFGLSSDHDDHDLYSVAAWRCKSCTLQNPEASTVCDMCWASRYDEPTFTDTQRGGLINTPRGEGEGDVFWNGSKSFLDSGKSNHREGGKLFSGLNISNDHHVNSISGKHLGSSFEMEDGLSGGVSSLVGEEENETPDGHQQQPQQKQQQHDGGGDKILLPPGRFSATPRGYDGKRHRRERSNDSFMNAILSTNVHEQDDYTFDAPAHNYSAITDNNGLALTRVLSSASSIGNVGGLNDLASLADSVLLQQQPNTANPVAQGLLDFKRGYRSDVPYCERSVSPSLSNVSPMCMMPSLSKRRPTRVHRQRSSTMIETEMAANVLTNDLRMASVTGHVVVDADDAPVQRLNLFTSVMAVGATQELPVKKRKSMSRNDSTSSLSTGIMSTCSTISSSLSKRVKTTLSVRTAASKKKTTVKKKTTIKKKKKTTKNNNNTVKIIQDIARVDVARELESVSIGSEHKQVEEEAEGRAGGGVPVKKEKGSINAKETILKKVTKRRGSVELLPTHNDKVAVLDAKVTFDESGKESVIEGVPVFHADTHPKKLRWKCRVCSKAFRQRVYLRVHVRTHTGARPIPCPKCPARFADPSNLRVHVRAHEGRMHTCEWAGCERMFLYRHSLREHMLGHTGQHPHKCACGHKFRNKSNMKKHQKTRCKLLSLPHAAAANAAGVAKTVSSA